MSAWLPMATAPRDGRLIRLLAENSFARVPVRATWDCQAGLWRVVGGPGPLLDIEFVGWQEIEA